MLFKFRSNSHQKTKPPKSLEIVTRAIEISCVIGGFTGEDLRTFSPIVTAHWYCARKFTRHVMHRARALSNKMNNDTEDGHCYSFAWI